MSEKWKDLLQTARDVAKVSRESSIDEDETMEKVFSMFTNIKEVDQVIHDYIIAVSRLSQNDGQSEEDGGTPEFLKPIILDSRRALRFMMCLLGIDSTRGEVQKQACLNYSIHKSISMLICQRQCDSKCRLMAAQILSNLGTLNSDTAEKIFEDIHSSPSESQVRNILLEKLSFNESEDLSGNLKENVCGDSSKSWALMIQASGGSGNRTILAAVVAALYNALISIESGRPDHAKDISSISRSLATDTMLMCNIVRYTLPSQVIEQQGGGQADGKTMMEASDLSDDATEWISRMLEKLCSLGMLPHMYRSLGSHATPTTDSDSCDDNEDQELDLEPFSLGITPEQLVLLHCIGSVVDEYVRTLHSSNHSDIHPLGGTSGIEGMKSSFRFLATEYYDLRRKLKGGSDGDGSDDSNNNAERYGGENACIENAVTLMIDLLANAMSVDETVDGESFAELRVHICQGTNLLQILLLDLGVLVDKLGIENRGINARELKIDDSDQNLVTGIVRLIGNICYRCTENQDSVRNTVVPVPHASTDNVEEYTQFAKNENTSNQGTRNGLHVLLSCTSFAYGCFTLREWAIIAIRNVLEDNEKNQKMVEELEAQQALETPELQKLGMKVDLDKRGQVRVTPHGR